jgi:hypothetical protein
MPERMPTSPPASPGAADAARDLDASVSAMIGQIARTEEAAAERDLAEFEALMPEEALSNSGHEIHAATGRSGTAPTPRVVVHRTDDDDLLRTVQELLAEAMQEEYVPTMIDVARTPSARPPSAEPGQTQARIETLDQELAGLADDLLETELVSQPEDFPDDPTLSQVPQEMATVIPAARANAPAERIASEDFGDAIDLSEPETESPAPQAPLSTAAAIDAAPQPRVVQIRLPRLSGSELLVLQRPLLLACAAISSPLKNKPQHIRDIIGWNALWLGFLGGCVWTYILFFRAPEAPAPSLLPQDTEHVESATSKPPQSDSHGGKAVLAGKRTAQKPAGH